MSATILPVSDQPSEPGQADGQERVGSERAGRTLDAALVGGGEGCASIIGMVVDATLERFPLRVLGVADIDPDAPGCRLARRLGVPVVTTDYRELLDLPGLDLIIELTGLDEVRDEIERTRPRHVHLIDHFSARLLWDLHSAELAASRHRDEARRRVEREREQTAQILDSIPDELVVLDTDMVIQRANSSFLENNGLTISEARGRHCYEVEQRIRGECQVAVENCPFQQVVRGAKPVSIVRKHFGDDGLARYAAIVAAPLRGPSGVVEGMIEMTRDITHRIRLEQDLAATEVNLRQFLEQAPLATYVKNRAGQYTDANRAACTLLGRPEQELLGHTDLELFSREAADGLCEGDREVWRSREPVSVETTVQLPGRRVHLSTTKFPILNLAGEPTALCGLSRDTSAQKEAEAKLLETREYLGNILDNSPVIVVTTDLDANVASFNVGAERSLGYAASEVIGRPVTLFWQDATEREELQRRVAAGDSVQDRVSTLVRKDGTVLPVSLTLSQLKDSTGRMIGTVGMSKDISQRQNLMRQVLQSERLAAVGRLASGVAHEINNPLAVISEAAGYLDDLVRSDGESAPAEVFAEVRDVLPRILNQVRRGRSITRRLLTFARKTEASVAIVDVNAALDEILVFLEKEAGLAQATVHRDYQQDLPPVAVEELLLQEVFINLITNAIHAVAHQPPGNVWVETREEEGKVVVAVRDDGPGIDESVRGRLFDPFVTTKPAEQGTGLGLSICYGIVKSCGGEIRVSSTPGEGATFRVVLPAYRGPAAGE